ncbi:MAG: hypothetical protein J6K31_10570 [Parabacteroides sp.]|nr:hypothetical protein [Parabacteroides sp.]
MNKKNILDYTFSILLCCFLFPTAIQAQSFLKKTLKVLDAVNEINKTNNTSKEENNKQNNVQLNTNTPNGFRITAPFQDLMFKIRSCTATGSTITLELTVKNRGKNQHFMFGGDDQRVRTIVVDDQDNSYDYEKIKIAFGDEYAEICKGQLFPTNVPIKMHIYINDVDPSAQMITMFTLRVEGFDTPITFYNIPIEHPVAIISTEDKGNTSTKSPTNVSFMKDEQKDTQTISQLKMIIGKWQLVSQKKDGKEIPFKSCTLEFHKTPEDDPYNKNMTETIAGKTQKSGYGIIPGKDELSMCLPSLTNDEEDNGYIIKTVDTQKLILTFNYNGVPGTSGELTFIKIN